MTKADIERLIIRLLADEAGRDAGELYAELASAGQALPVDSLLAAEVLARVQDACGVELPTDGDTARALRSVTTFARAVWELLPEEQRQQASA